MIEELPKFNRDLIKQAKNQVDFMKILFDMALDQQYKINEIIAQLNSAEEKGKS